MRYLIPILVLVALLAGTHTAHAWPCSERPNEAHCLTSTPLRHHKTPTPVTDESSSTPTRKLRTHTPTKTAVPTPEDTSTSTPLVPTPVPTCPHGWICQPDTGSGGYIH